MSAEGRPPHAVLVRSPEKFSAVTVAAVLAARAQKPALDFALSARRAWGVVAEGEEAQSAHTLAALLTEKGQAAVAAPSSLLESPAAAVVALKAELGREGFELTAAKGEGEPERLPWSRLSVICAAAFEVRQSRVVTGTTPTEMTERAVRLGLTMVTGLPLMKSKTQTKTVVESKDRALQLDLLFIEPPRRVRIDARAFDYSLLGGAMGYGAEANFLALLSELAARAPQALLGQGTRALLSKAPASQSLYESLEDLEREERWLLSLSVLRAAL
jgi:hypothetical protein